MLEVVRRSRFMEQPMTRRAHFTLVLALALYQVCFPMLPAPGQEEGVVEEAVVVDEGGAVSTENDSAAADFAARPIEPRLLEGQNVYIRHSSDAFDDPDQRMSLEPKYFFVLPRPEPSTIASPSAASLSRNARITAPPNHEDLARRAEALGDALTSNQSADAVALWLDYNNPKPKLLATLAPADADSATLSVFRAKIDGDAVLLERLAAQRSILRRNLATEPRNSIATWDFPKDWAGKSLFLNRLVAVLGCVDGRYCVDFYGTNLNPDADCRVWLMRKQDIPQRPVALRFTEIHLLRETGKVAPVSVLAVRWRAPDGQLSEMAIDFPLCRPAVMEQMQKLAADRKTADSANQQGPDLEKIVGADLLEEFARRLVNGTYR
jgi:hypothetical protein